MKKFLAGAMFGAVAIGGVGIANAQSTTTPATTTSATVSTTAGKSSTAKAGTSTKSNNGGFAAHAPAIAKALGISTDELNTQMAAGKTIAALAKEKGVDLNKIIATYVAEEQAEHPEMSAADVTARVTARVNNVNTGGKGDGTKGDGTKEGRGGRGGHGGKGGHGKNHDDNDDDDDNKSADKDSDKDSSTKATTAPTTKAA